jgi:hypothetical protein
MNIYLITLIEIVLYTLFAFLLGKQLGIFTDDQDIVTLNYIFWGFVIASSVLINFHQYLYFGSVFVIGIIVMCIYIFKVIGVEYFVDANMTPYFWLLYALFCIALAVIIMTKRVLITSRRSQALQGDEGESGKIGMSGKSYFIETLGDQIYVKIIEGIESYFRSILDTNEISYDTAQSQFNNYYLKDVIKRISNSTQMIEYVSDYTSGHCKYTATSSKRECVDDGNPITVDGTSINCSVDSDCVKTNTGNKQDESAKIAIIITFIKTKWIDTILKNTPTDDKKLLIKEKGSRFYSKLNDSRIKHRLKKMGIKDGPPHKKRLNNAMGRKFLQSHFELESYWNRVTDTDPFTTIHNDKLDDAVSVTDTPVWIWGTAEASSDAHNKCPQ